MSAGAHRPGKRCAAPTVEGRRRRRRDHVILGALKPLGLLRDSEILHGAQHVRGCHASVEALSKLSLPTGSDADEGPAGIEKRDTQLPTLLSRLPFQLLPAVHVVPLGRPFLNAAALTPAKQHFINGVEVPRDSVRVLLLLERRDSTRATRPRA